MELTSRSGSWIWPQEERPLGAALCCPPCSARAAGLLPLLQSVHLGAANQQKHGMKPILKAHFILVRGDSRYILQQE